MTPWIWSIYCPFTHSRLKQVLTEDSFVIIEEKYSNNRQHNTILTSKRSLYVRKLNSIHARKMYYVSLWTGWLRLASDTMVSPPIVNHIQRYTWKGLEKISNSFMIGRLSSLKRSSQKNIQRRYVLIIMIVPAPCTFYAVHLLLILSKYIKCKLHVDNMIGIEDNSIVTTFVEDKFSVHEQIS